MKMEQIECSEMSAYKIQTPGNHPEENIQHTEHGESLKSKINLLLDFMLQTLALRLKGTFIPAHGGNSSAVLTDCTTLPTQLYCTHRLRLSAAGV
jgi:hypothetical protein